MVAVVVVVVGVITARRSWYCGGVYVGVGFWLLLVLTVVEVAQRQIVEVAQRRNYFAQHRHELAQCQNELAQRRNELAQRQKSSCSAEMRSRSAKMSSSSAEMSLRRARRSSKVQGGRAGGEMRTLDPHPPSAFIAMSHPNKKRFLLC